MWHIRNTLWLALAVFIAAVLAITGYVLARSHTQAIVNSLEISAMHARSFEDFLTESLYFAELLAANGLLQEQVQQEQLQQSLPRIEQTLVAILRRAPLLRSMSLQDEHGRIIASSNRANLGLLVYEPGGTEKVTGVAYTAGELAGYVDIVVYVPLQ